MAEESSSAGPARPLAAALSSDQPHMVAVEIMIVIACELVVSSCLKLLNKNYTKQLTPSQQQCDARQTILHAASSEQHMYSKVLLL